MKLFNQNISFVNSLLLFRRKFLEFDHYFPITVYFICDTVQFKLKVSNQYFLKGILFLLMAITKQDIKKNIVSLEQKIQALERFTNYKI